MASMVQSTAAPSHISSPLAPRIDATLKLADSEGTPKILTGRCNVTQDPESVIWSGSSVLRQNLFGTMEHGLSGWVLAAEVCT
mmetsp:Transcript_8183/g.16521  ORF Transcript_8183/g.16521 Transcript_8183/m.16521 type:complete len:83 (+) Transcript_8183:1653-1901(+)